MRPEELGGVLEVFKDLENMPWTHWPISHWEYWKNTIFQNIQQNPRRVRQSHTCIILWCVQRSISNKTKQQQQQQIRRRREPWSFFFSFLPFCPFLTQGVSSTVLLGGPLRYFYRYWSTPENLVAKKVITFIETYQISQNHTPQFIFQLHLYSGGVWPLSPPLDTPLP